MLNYDGKSVFLFPQFLCFLHSLLRLHFFQQIYIYFHSCFFCYILLNHVKALGLLITHKEHIKTRGRVRVREKANEKPIIMLNKWFWYFSRRNVTRQHRMQKRNEQYNIIYLYSIERKSVWKYLKMYWNRRESLTNNYFVIFLLWTFLCSTSLSTSNITIFIIFRAKIQNTKSKRNILSNEKFVISIYC